MTALSAITIKGFKSIGSVKGLPIRPINVLIGANGSGKSNFLGVFKLLQAIRAGGLQNYVARAGGADRILHFGSKVTEEVIIRITLGAGYPQYEITLDATDDDRMSPSEEVLHSQENGAPSPMRTQLNLRMPGERTVEAEISEPRPRVPPDDPWAWDMATVDIQDHLKHWRVYHFLDTGATSPIKKHNDLHDNRFLRPDGANLAAFLYLLREKYASEYDLIRRTVRLAAPFFEDFHLEPLALNEDKIRLEWRHSGPTPISMPPRSPTARCGSWPWRPCCYSRRRCAPRSSSWTSRSLACTRMQSRCWPRWSSRPLSRAGSFWPRSRRSCWTISSRKTCS